MTILKKSTSITSPSVLLGQDGRLLYWRWFSIPTFVLVHYYIYWMGMGVHLRLIDKRLSNFMVCTNLPILWGDYLGNPATVSDGATSSDQMYASRVTSSDTLDTFQWHLGHLPGTTLFFQKATPFLDKLMHLTQYLDTALANSVITPIQKSTSLVTKLT